MKQISAVLLALLLFSTACGDDTDSVSGDGDLQEQTDGAASRGDDSGDQSNEDPATTTTASPEATTTTSSGPKTTDVPQRIVSLSPTATEILFAVGAAEQVVAVDQYSYYPPEAPVTDLSGWDPNVEAVLAYEPDLVLISNDANDLVAAMEAVGIEVLLSPAPADFEGGYDAVADIGTAVGRADEAAALVADLRAEIEAALAGAPDLPIRIYHELGESHFSASSNSFIGAVYAAMGAVNIADEADADGNGFPQLTEEYIVNADPELIVITDMASYTAADVAARPGWGEVSAVRNGDIVVVDADIASRWGPRLPQFITAVAAALQSTAASVS